MNVVLIAGVYYIGVIICGIMSNVHGHRSTIVHSASTVSVVISIPRDVEKKDCYIDVLDQVFTLA